MDALLMCGGRGTRLDVSVEKPLFEIGGRPMIDYVKESLDESEVDDVYAVVSPHVPNTRSHLADVATIETPGDGYVNDLDRALDAVDQPALTVAADLPLLSGDSIDDVLESHENGSLTVSVPAALKRVLGVSVGTTFKREGRELSPTGVNIVSKTGPESTYATYNARFAINVNFRSDARIAEELV